LFCQSAEIALPKNIIRIGPVPFGESPERQKQLAYLLQIQMPQWRHGLFVALYNFFQSKGSVQLTDAVLDEAWHTIKSAAYFSWLFSTEPNGQLSQKEDEDVNEFEIENFIGDDGSDGDDESNIQILPAQREWLRDRIGEMQAFLVRFSDVRLLEREYQQHKEKEHKQKEEQRAKKAQKDESLDAEFFDKATPNLERWAKLPSWSVEEAVALSFSKSPNEIAQWLTNRGNRPRTRSSVSYEDRLDLFNRAVLIDALKPQGKPAEFIRWANSFEIAFPEEIVKASAISEDAQDRSATTHSLSSRNIRLIVEVLEQCAQEYGMYYNKNLLYKLLKDTIAAAGGKNLSKNKFEQEIWKKLKAKHAGRPSESVREDWGSRQAVIRDALQQKLHWK
jgi:hypothetical protein